MKTIYIPIYGDQAAGAGTQHAVILRSLDGGTTWKRLDDPCGTRAGQVFDAISLAASSGGFLSAICVPRMNGVGPGDFLLTTMDSGSTWSSPKPIPDWAQSIAAATPSRLVASSPGVSGNGQFLYRLAVSRDGGAHWATVVKDQETIDPDAPGSTLLGFESALVGRWIGYPTAVWTTRDGGLTWIKHPIS